MVLSLILSGGLIFLPEESNKKELAADKLLMELNDDTRFVSTDEVANLIISQDPTLLLIDLRDSIEYAKFSLEGAMNMPFETILDKENKELLGRVELKKVFYGNNDLSSEQAWVLLRRAEYKNIFVMKGGLTEWVHTIMKPTKPADEMSQTAIELYNDRMAARRYFSGGSVEIVPDAFAGKVEKVAPVSVKKKKKKVLLKKAVEEVEEEEGC